MPYDLKEIVVKASAELFRKMQSAHVDTRVAVLQKKMDRDMKEYAKKMYEDHNNGVDKAASSEICSTSTWSSFESAVPLL